MNIDILHYASGAAMARGLAVIIDVFRAFSLACYIFDRGALEIIATQEIDRAFELKGQHPEYLLVGERHAEKIPGFDYGNSPTEIQEVDLSGRVVVHTTHAGTQALMAARMADQVITGSFVNAGAILRHIREISPGDVSLVCAGFEGREQTLEDTLCAEYLRDALVGQNPDFEEIRERILRSGCSRRFLDPTDSSSPQSDLDLCLQLDRFSFTIRRARLEDGRCHLRPVDDQRNIL
jgi:2-phosphosulfolactate phosphatase